MCYTFRPPEPYEITPGLQRYYANIRNAIAADSAIHSTEIRAQAFPLVAGFFQETLYPMTWGLRPAWAENNGESKKGRTMTLNCISEEMFGKASYRHLAATNRCLIPAKYFLEWRHEDDGSKTKYKISLEDSDIMYLGGLCQLFEDSYYFTICTMAANEVMAFIHNTKKRQPVIIQPEYFEQWLTPGGPEQIADIIRPDNNLPLHTLNDKPAKQNDLFT